MPNKQLEALAKVISDRGDVLILPHNDPDPDAIAAAVSLGYLLNELFQVESQIVYQGHIGRAENKALVQYLEKPLRHIKHYDLQSASKIALVDTQPGAGNNSLPTSQTADIVIDHHPLRDSTGNSNFFDVRPELGATSTILTDYLLEAEIDPPSKIATALFFGIKTDTMGLSRNANPIDVNAYLYLQPRIDVNAMTNIEQAQVPLEYFQNIDNAIHASRIFDEDTVIAYLGKVPYPDLCAELADFFMRLRGIQWVLCMGVFRDELILSVRSRNKRIGAGKLVSAIIGDKGTAGGHGIMAAGHINLREGNEPDQIAADLEKAMLFALKGTHAVEFKQMV
jgi:nanoRNase/pAp phosphatase (c-di-AMP/oligoRNAs hydrolase)